MDGEIMERVRGIVSAIPAGSVLAYGEVAALAGLPGRARLVGRILAEDGHDLPWYRVLRTDGAPAPHLVSEQLARLRAEGVRAEDGRVSMRRYGAEPLLCHQAQQRCHPKPPEEIPVINDTEAGPKQQCAN